MKRLEYYEHLRTLGLSEDNALRMAKQAGKDNRAKCVHPSYAVSSFAIWAATDEGHEFWRAVRDSFPESE